MKLGIECFLEDKDLQQKMMDQRVGLMAHPASTNRQLQHSLDLLKQQTSLNITCAFGPQHGMRGEKQDNMIESDDYLDPKYSIPVFSLYGDVRRPTSEMMEAFDVLLFDLQDVGCRIYTFVTTLVYFLEACHKSDKKIVVLDRPNPAGRPIEGHFLHDDYHTFVGAIRTPMRHGMTLGEVAHWYVATQKLEVQLDVVKMEGYNPEQAPGWGWPCEEISWVNPSPNMPTLNCARVYCGSVLLEGTMLSEGRGTTTPLSVFGAPGMEGELLVKTMKELREDWMQGGLLRPCFYEPTFHKFVGELCGGLQVHVDDQHYDHHKFRPYRLIALYLKAVKQCYPKFHIWREPPYEYEDKIKPFDMLSGSDVLRLWVDDPHSSFEDLEQSLHQDEKEWHEQREPFLLY